MFNKSLYRYITTSDRNSVSDNRKLKSDNKSTVNLELIHARKKNIHLTLMAPSDQIKGIINVVASDRIFAFYVASCETPMMVKCEIRRSRDRNMNQSR